MALVEVSPVVRRSGTHRQDSPRGTRAWGGAWLARPAKCGIAGPGGEVRVTADGPERPGALLVFSALTSRADGLSQRPRPADRQTGELADGGPSRGVPGSVVVEGERGG
ncbi:hypothetical protein Pen01_65920 [Phytomonospora endophytica]|nr:hypothetical protein Pen01_65920 [Phytomonospora endophytica]